MIHSLRIKLAASHTLPLLLLMPVLTLYLLYSLEGVFNDSFLLQMRNEGLLLQDQLQQSKELLEEPQAIQPLLVRMGRLTNAHILLLSKDSKMVASSRPEDAPRFGTVMNDQAIAKALSGTEVEGLDPSSSGEVAFVLLPLRYKGATLAALRLSYDVGDVRAAFLRVERLVLAGGLLTLVFGLGIGLGLATTITRPLQQLSESAERISAGDYQARAEVRSGDEVGSLARHFNRMAERLEEDDKARVRQLAAIVHELARPLSGMRAAVDTLCDGAASDECARTPLLEGIAEEMGRLQRLVETLEQVQKRTLHPLELDRAPVHIERIIRASTANYQLLAAQSGISLSIELPPDLPRVSGDEDRLIQVLTNLLDNAFKYTPPGGRVTVRAATGLEGISVSVSDSGVGIAPQEMPYIFREFYRGGTSHPSEKRGMGLGLAICREIITAHEGSIKAENAPTGGTCITFTVPRAFNPA